MGFTTIYWKGIELNGQELDVDNEKSGDVNTSLKVSTPTQEVTSKHIHVRRLDIYTCKRYHKCIA